MTSFYIEDLNRSHISVQIATLISTSSNGEIYSINKPSHSGLDGLIFKRLSKVDQSIEMQAKIEYMVAHQPQTVANSQSRICWPLHCVYDDNHVFVGYLMLSALGGSLSLDKIFNNIESCSNAWHVFEENTQASCELRLKTCINICQALRSINEINRYIFTDLSPVNIMVTHDGQISLIECDLIIKSNNAADKVAHFDSKSMAGYTPPETLGINVSTNTYNETQERFPLSVIAYELMFRVHPYAATFNPPYAHLTTLDEKVENSLFVHGGGSNHIHLIPSEHHAFDAINHKLKSLFHLAFDIKSKDRRPTAQLWEETLTLLLNEKKHGLQPQPNLNITTSQPDIANQNRNNKTNVSPVYINTNDTANANGLNRNVKASWWSQGQSKLAIIIFLLLIGVITVLATTDFDSNTENAAEYLYDARQQVSDSEVAWNDNKPTSINNRAKVNILDIDPPKLTDQFLYVLSDKANLRQRPSLNSPVVMKLEYNTKLVQTESPLVEDGGVTWINVASNVGTMGWMSSITLSKYPRDILYSRCGVKSNEVEYIVASAGVNIRNRANTNDDSVIGVIQKGEIVCPYMYVETYDKSIKRWMGFQLTNGGTAWVAESLLEPYYDPKDFYEPESEPEPEPENLHEHEPDESLSDTDDDSYATDYNEDNSWF